MDLIYEVKANSLSYFLDFFGFTAKVKKLKDYSKNIYNEIVDEERKTPVEIKVFPFQGKIRFLNSFSMYFEGDLPIRCITKQNEILSKDDILEINGREFYCVDFDSSDSIIMKQGLIYVFLSTKRTSDAGF